ncbi:MAG TPA: cellulase family glycosylhydrolase [Chitinophagales bacterium]|nr:cellulase family glycosylhydrolase [Chitinophagales bacterium]
MQLLHAEIGDKSGIYDAAGRYMILRGVNYNCLGYYWQANSQVAVQKQPEEADFKLMATYGFNCVRLLFSWSKLEPAQGQYDYNYIEQIKKYIEIAGKYGLYVLIDMHQDAWGKYIATPQSVNCSSPNKGWDGAPLWATLTDSASTCKNTTDRESAPAVVHAFENFWNNKQNIQTACLNAWAELAKNCCVYENVLGYDLLNEPGLGYSNLLDGSSKMSRFYGDAIRRIRAAEQSVNGFQHIIFFETSITQNGNPLPFIPSFGFTNDKNIAFAPHTYFEAISYALTIEQGYDLLKTISALFKTPMLIGEYGFFDGYATDSSKLARFAVKEDANFGSSTYWQWSQAPGDPHSISYDGLLFSQTNMALIELDKNGNFTGNINKDYLKVLSRSRPVAVAGKPTYLSSNINSGKLSLYASLSGSGTTILWVPSGHGTPVVSGTNIVKNEIQQVDGGFRIAVEVNGDYKIHLSF